MIVKGIAITKQMTVLALGAVSFVIVSYNQEIPGMSMGSSRNDTNWVTMICSSLITTLIKVSARSRPITARAWPAAIRLAKVMPLKRPCVTTDSKRASKA